MVGAEEWLLESKDVAAMVGLSGTTIYRRIQAGRFPRPVSTGARAVRWRLTDLRAWIAALPATEPGLPS